MTSHMIVSYIAIGIIYYDRIPNYNFSTVFLSIYDYLIEFTAIFVVYDRERMNWLFLRIFFFLYRDANGDKFAKVNLVKTSCIPFRFSSNSSEPYCRFYISFHWWWNGKTPTRIYCNRMYIVHVSNIQTRSHFSIYLNEIRFAD